MNSYIYSEFRNSTQQNAKQLKYKLIDKQPSISIIKKMQ